MTVAAIILARDPDAALARAGGTTRLRRLVDVAWSGGAVPTVVVGRDPDGRLVAAVAGAEAAAVSDPPSPADSVGAVLAGFDLAVGLVEATDAVLVWPVEMAWVDPETVTSLIEAHGADPGAPLRPTYGGQPGAPILVPRPVLAAWRRLPPATPIEDALASVALAVRLLDLGDPGVVVDAATPADRLPPYVGPLQPPAGHVHEWGEAVAGEVGRDPESPDPEPPVERGGRVGP